MIYILIKRLGVARRSLWYVLWRALQSHFGLTLPARYRSARDRPLTGGPYAAARLSEGYFFKYLSNKKLTTRKHVEEAPLTSMQGLAKTELWSAYLARNNAAKQARFFATDIDDFLAAMKASGEHLQATR